jgi:hypothetical protein
MCDNIVLIDFWKDKKMVNKIKQLLNQNVLKNCISCNLK